jgi:hypothetical protein
LVEAVSHVADTLSYYQDAVGTEAYLDTARQRTSIRRHARLTDQRISEGAGARTWLQFEVSEDVSVPAGTMAGTAPQAVRRATLGSTENLVFRTSRALWAVVEQNQMIPYTWGVVPMTLPEGATSMSLNGHLTSLRAGDVLILEAIGGLNGALIRHPIRLVEDAQLDFDAARQSPITRIRWGHSDALSNPFHLDDSPGSPSTTVVRGNNVLSEQGEFLSVPNRDLNSVSSILLRRSLRSRWYRLTPVVVIQCLSRFLTCCSRSPWTLILSWKCPITVMCGCGLATVAKGAHVRPWGNCASRFVPVMEAQEMLAQMR